MVQFWLDNPLDLFSGSNFSFLNNDPKPENYVKALNLISLISILICFTLTFVKKDPVYFAILVVILSFCILINSNIPSSFTATPQGNLTNSYDTGVYLVQAVKNDPNNINNVIYTNTALNFNKGDILAFSVNDRVLETNIISDVKSTPDNLPVIILLNDIKKDYSKYTTRILKVSDSSPNIIAPPDGNMSIGSTNFNSDPHSMAVQNYHKFDLPNGDRNDWNLELSTMGPNGMSNPYTYQGPPYGNLKCRESTLNNPMGVIEVPEYDSAPTMFGTCNESEIGSNGIENNINMTTNQEATVSQRVDDLLFHKGNSQSNYSPVPVDTLPNDQEGFAHFCYRSPTNLVNVKYGSIFVNEPEKFKLVTRLAQATGSEGGGAGGGGGRG
jgi:hypothetical protein